MPSTGSRHCWLVAEGLVILGEDASHEPVPGEQAGDGQQRLTGVRPALTSDAYEAGLHASNFRVVVIMMLHSNKTAQN